MLKNYNSYHLECRQLKRYERQSDLRCRTCHQMMNRSNNRQGSGLQRCHIDGVFGSSYSEWIARRSWKGCNNKKKVQRHSGELTPDGCTSWTSSPWWSPCVNTRRVKPSSSIKMLGTQKGIVLLQARFRAKVLLEGCYNRWYYEVFDYIFSLSHQYDTHPSRVFRNKDQEFPGKECWQNIRVHTAQIGENAICTWTVSVETSEFVTKECMHSLFWLLS